MQESDVEVLCALAWSLVDKAYALFVTLCQSIGNTVLYTESNVVNTMVALIEPLLYGALRRCWLEKLKLNLATLEESSLHLLVFHYFHCVTLQSQYVLKVWERLLNALDCYAQVLNMRNLHSLCI